jgi:hypothetical protein
MNPRTFIARATLLYVAVALTTGIARAQSPIVTQNTGTADFGPNTNIFAFANGSVNFYAAFDGLPVITNQWVYSSTGSGFTAIDGATGNLYVLTNVQDAAAGWYQCYATNGHGSTNSTSAHLTALANPGEPSNIGTNAYSYCIYTNHPWAYWKFEETNNSLKNSMQAYDYSGNNFDATYGNGDGTAGSGCRDGGQAWAQNLGGPGSSKSSEAYGTDHYAGFPSTNACAQLSYNHDNGYLTVPPLNLNTNTVTFTMWIYPNSDVIAAGTGLLMNRNGADGAGIGFGSVLQTNSGGRSMPCLSYIWNSNNPATYGWNTGLYPIGGLWSFVACVVTPTNTTMYLYYVNSGVTNMLKSSFVMTNNPEAFDGLAATRLGGDSAGGDGGTFDGNIDEVAVFTNAMNEDRVQDLFLKALGLNTGVAPVFSVQPTNVTVWFEQTLQLSVAVGGIPNPNFQWQFSWDKVMWTNVVDNAGIGVSGATSNTLSMTHYPYFSYSGITNFRCIAANPFGSATSSVASVTVFRWFERLIWTVNFAITTTNGGGTGVPFYGHGVLGSGSYWNALQGDQFTNATSYRDDGPTVIGVHFGSTNFGLAATSFGTNNALLDTFCYFGSSGTAFVFTSVPNGRYNLALYGIDGAYANRGTIFTVNGVNQSITNAQDSVFWHDNTVIFTNVLVSHGSLEVAMMPVPSVPSHNPNTEGDFNGAQLQLLKYAPQPVRPIGPETNGTFHLTWVGGGLLEANDVSGPWVTNTAVSPYIFIPTGSMKFYRIYNPDYQ